MTTIYKILNVTNQQIDYVCDSQKTIDDGQAAGYTGNFLIGDMSLADTTLALNQVAWLTDQSPNFIIQKSIVNEDDSHTWILCNLATESENTNELYNFLNFPNGNWLGATGLDAAKELQIQIQQSALAWANLNSYTTLSEWYIQPIQPKKNQPKSTGTQII